MPPLRDARLSEIEALYRARFTHFVRVATAVAGDQQLALEAVQDAFAGAVRSRRGYRAKAPLEAWLWRAVVNSAQKARLREARSGLAAMPEDRRNGHEASDAEAITTAIALLPERQRLALLLRYYADLEYRSMAEALDVEIGTVSATLNAAHSSIRRVLQEVLR